MQFSILVIQKAEWEGADCAQSRLLSECGMKGIRIVRIDRWQELDLFENFPPAAALTCTDAGILAAERRGLAVLAFRNQSFEDRYGRQELWRGQVLLESFSDIHPDFLEQIYNRAKDLLLSIGITKRCQIREISETDISRLYVLQSGNINKDSLHPIKLPFLQYREFWRAYRREMYRFYGYGLWLVMQCDEIIGLAGIEHADYDFLEDPVPELAYWIREEFRQRGYAKEVCRFLLHYAREQLGMDALSLFIKEQNQASVSLAQSLGFSEIKRYWQDGGEIRRYMKSLQF